MQQVLLTGIVPQLSILPVRWDFGGTGRTRGLHPIGLYRAQIGGQTRIVVGLVAKVLTPKPRGGLCATVRCANSIQEGKR